VPRELGKPGEELTLDVTAFSVDESAPAALRAALPELTQRFTGPGRSYEDLVNAASAVTRYLQRELGYYLGYAYLPEQVPANGVIRIAVLEGRLDEVILNWPEKMPVDRAVVEAYLARLKPGEILRVRDVERIVFLVNDLRGLNARFEVKAGRTPGTASLVVTAQAEERVTSRVEVDSMGSRYSGVYRANVQATVASLAGRGDGLVVNLLSSFTRGLEFVLAGYTLPVGSDGLKVGISGSYTKYKLDEDLLDVSLSGDAQPQPVRPGLSGQQAFRRQAVRHEPEEVVERSDSFGFWRRARRPAHRRRQHFRADRAARQARLRSKERQRQPVELHDRPSVRLAAAERGEQPAAAARQL
jgi:hemolysin activation/secretion protein